MSVIPHVDVVECLRYLRANLPFNKCVSPLKGKYVHSPIKKVVNNAYLGLEGEGNTLRMKNSFVSKIFP